MLEKKIQELSERLSYEEEKEKVKPEEEGFSSRFDQFSKEIL